MASQFYASILASYVELLIALQEENVKRKAQLTKRKAESKDGEGKSGTPAAKKRKKQWWEVELQGSKRPAQVDDDAEYYRQEVGPCPSI